MDTILVTNITSCEVTNMSNINTEIAHTCLQISQNFVPVNFNKKIMNFKNAYIFVAKVYYIGEKFNFFHFSKATFLYFQHNIQFNPILQNIWNRKIVQSYKIM